MRVAFCMTKKFFETGGGGRIQILKTKEYLDKLFNLDIYIAHSVKELQKNTQVLHLFNLLDADELQPFVFYAKSNRIKICLSPIFWDYKYALMGGTLGKLFGYNYSDKLFLLENAVSKFTGKIFGKPYFYSSKNKRKFFDLVTSVDILLPNSVEEGDKLIEYIGANKKCLKIKPVVNAIELKITKDFVNYNLPKKYILEVARIEPIKNQYLLVRALYNQKEIPIVFLGKDYFPKSRYSRNLHDLCKKRGNVFFFNEIPYEDVHYFYENAMLHILPSLRESPGLVSLEALFYGCKAVVSDDRFTPANSYFSSFVTTINPLSSESIQEGIFFELKEKRDFSSIKKYITDNFTWEKCAEQTFQAYKEALGD